MKLQNNFKYTNTTQDNTNFVQPTLILDQMSNITEVKKDTEQ